MSRAQRGSWETLYPVSSDVNPEYAPAISPSTWRLRGSKIPIFESVHELSNIICVYSSITEPNWKVVAVQANVVEFGPASYSIKRVTVSTETALFSHNSLTMGWLRARHVGIVGGPAGEKVHSRRAAPCHCAVVLVVGHAVPTNQAFDLWLHGEGVEKLVCARSLSTARHKS